jgi:hypothetical protein
MTTPTQPKEAWTLLIDDDAQDVMGKVTASPEAYTLLGRLKAIADATGSMAGTVDVSDRAARLIGTFTAQPGVDIGDVTINNAAGASAVNVQDGGNSFTIDSPQLPAALAANGGLKVEGVVGGVAQPVSAAQLPAALGQAAMAASMPVVIASDQTPVAARGTAFSVTGSITRPADTTQYATGDQVSNHTATPTIVTLASVARIAGAGVWINNVALVSTNPAAAAGSFRLHLFDTTLTPNNDNAAFNPSDGERLTEVARFDLDVADYGTSNYRYTLSAPWPKYVKCLGTSLFASLEARNAYTPANAEVFSILLQGQQD